MSIVVASSSLQIGELWEILPEETMFFPFLSVAFALPQKSTFAYARTVADVAFLPEKIGELW